MSILKLFTNGITHVGFSGDENGKDGEDDHRVAMRETIGPEVVVAIGAQIRGRDELRQSDDVHRIHDDGLLNAWLVSNFRRFFDFILVLVDFRYQR